MLFLLSCGCSSAVEHHVANVRVVSSNLITRYKLIFFAGVAQWQSITLPT